jgi:hypothetical protein
MKFFIETRRAENRSPPQFRDSKRDFILLGSPPRVGRAALMASSRQKALEYLKRLYLTATKSINSRTSSRAAMLKTAGMALPDRDQ